MAVCLHCLHNARVEARERRRRAIVRFSAWTLSLTVVGVVGTAAVNAAMHPAEPSTVQVGARHVSAKAPAAPKRDSILTVASASVVEQQGAPASATPIVDSTTTPVTAPVAAAPVTPATDSAASRPTAAAGAAILLRPVIPQGRTDLPDSLSRTRRADKFEAVVRQTLRAVYGDAADSLLAAVPEGQLVSPNELLTKLPTRGIHLVSASGARLQLWPVTRPGRDGPLVVAYRAVVEH